jgi:glyoxylate reductase
MSDRADILVTRKLPASALAILRTAGPIEIASVPLDQDALRAAVAGRRAVVCLLTDRIDDAVLEAAGPSLKIVANVAVGYDNVDLAAARARGVVVTNTPDVLTNSVAEFTWALILAVTRRVAEGDRLVRRGDWSGWGLDFMLGTELAGKQLGIVGAGRIGRAVAARAKAFGVRVAFAGRGPASAVDGVGTMSLDELLISSDIVSLHVPLTADTRHVIDKKTLMRMKRSAYLINTSRGAVIDEAALVWAMNERLLAGVALDVYEHEPQVASALLAMDNVVLAPHIGSATRETRTLMADAVTNDVARVLAGHAPENPVNAPTERDGRVPPRVS